MDQVACGAAQGVPPELRPRVWPQVSGAAARQAAHIAGYYEAMVQRGAAEAEFVRQIELVRPRTPASAWACTHPAATTSQKTDLKTPNP